MSRLYYFLLQLATTHFRRSASSPRAKSIPYHVLPWPPRCSSSEAPSPPFKRRKCTQIEKYADVAISFLFDSTRPSLCKLARVYRTDVGNMRGLSLYVLIAAPVFILLNSRQNLTTSSHSFTTFRARSMSENTETQYTDDAAAASVNPEGSSAPAGLISLHHDHRFVFPFIHQPHRAFL